MIFYNPDFIKFPLNTNELYINPVNCVGVMGAGLAKEYATYHPTMFSEYKKFIANKILHVNSFFYWTADNYYIYNFPTKVHWKDKSEYKYIIDGMELLLQFISTQMPQHIKTINIPMLGCGKGGLDNEKVEKIITDTIVKSNINKLFCIYIGK